MNRMICKKRALVLCWVVYFLFSLNQGFAITWGAPQTISPLAGAGNVDLALNDNDIALASWTSWNGSINRVAAAFFNGSWQAPTYLTTTVSVESRAAINSNNNAIVAFIDPSGSTNTIQACFYNGTSWSAPVTLSSTSLNASHLDLSMNDSDEALVVWRSEGGPSPMIEAAFFNGATWSSSVAISNASTFSDNPRVSLNNASEAFAIWESFDTISVYDIQVALFNGTTWASPVVISDPANESVRPKIKMNSLGNAVAIWETVPSGGGDLIIRSAYYTNALSLWSPQINVTAGSGLVAFSSDLAFNNLGHAVVVWTELLSAFSFEVNTSLSLSLGSWTATALILSTGAPSSSPRVSINEFDVIVTSFLSSSGGVNEVHANTYELGVWTGSSNVSNVGVLSFDPVNVLNNNSISFVGWDSEINNGSIRVSQGTFP